MAEYREYIVRETTLPLGGTRQEVVGELVRCKECFYAIPYNEQWVLPKKNDCLWCKRYEDSRTLDWFCADGERREDVSNC